MRGAKVKACLEEGLVEAFNGCIERQHHEGHVDVNQAKDDGEVVVEHFKGPKPHNAQCNIDVTLGAEHRDQGVGPDQQVDPEWQHHEKQEDGLPAVGREADAKGNGIGGDKAQDRCNGTDPDGFPHDAEVKVVQ